MSNQISAAKNLTTPFHIYYDVSFYNGNEEGLEQLCQFIDQGRSKPLLDSSYKYFCSIVRFQLNTSSLPVFVPAMDKDTYSPSNPTNNTKYKVCEVNYSNFPPTTAFFNTLQYVNTSDLSISAPSAPLKKSDYSNRYFYINSYEQLLTMVNDGLSLLSGPHAPFMRYNVNNSLFQIYIPTSYPSGTNAVGFNDYLATLFSGFAYTRFYDSVSSSYVNYINVNVENSEVETINMVDYYVVNQMYPSTPLINPIRSIVFLSQLMPTIPTIVNNTQALGIKQEISQNNNLSNIVTDFEIDPSNFSNLYTPSILYEPAEYRLFDMIGNDAVQFTNFSIAWKDKYGNINPVYLKAGEICDIKLMFRRKDFNNIDLE